MTFPTSAVVASALVSLLPAAVLAVASPDPSTLKAALASPPTTDYVEADLGTSGEGSYDTAGYAAFTESNATRRAIIQARLVRDGFAAGYGRLWAKKGGGSALVEQILAFADHSGATSFYGSSKLADLAATQYKGTIDTSSIPSSYGVQDQVTGAFTSAVVFVKGNDLLVVAYASVSDYLVSDTLAQAQTEYSVAPDYTIQPAGQVTNLASGSNVPLVAGLIAAGVLVLLVVVGLIVFLAVRSRRPSTQLAGTAISMSPDGHYWWDGVSWHDAAAMAPAHAQRSPDGAYWWDGQAWHQVPRP